MENTNSRIVIKNPPKKVLDFVAEITVLGTRMNGGWFAIAYDIHVRYGYEAMLSLFDRFVSQFQVRVDIIAKATMAGVATFAAIQEGHIIRTGWARQ